MTNPSTTQASTFLTLHFVPSQAWWRILILSASSGGRGLIFLPGGQGGRGEHIYEGIECELQRRTAAQGSTFAARGTGANKHINILNTNTSGTRRPTLAGGCHAQLEARRSKRTDIARRSKTRFPPGEANQNKNIGWAPGEAKLEHDQPRQFSEC